MTKLEKWIRLSMIVWFVCVVSGLYLVVSYVKEVGLKPIVERVWYGRSAK